jgi:clorobiocin biosynthesis protein CloN5
VPADEIVNRLVTFIEETLRPSEMEEHIQPDTPLLDLGILDSLKTAILLNFIRDELGVAVPPTEMIGKNFKDPATIAAMVNDLAAVLNR